MIDFDIARTWHRIFAEKLEFFSAGLIKQAPLLDQVSNSTACQLGQWLHGPGERLAQQPAYRWLMKSHERFHRIACYYLSVSVGNSDPLKRAAENEFKHASGTVLAAIDALEAAAAVDRETSAYVTQYAEAMDTERIDWDGALAIGLPAIDNQHRILVDMFNRLMTHPGATLHEGAVINQLTELDRMFALHFAVEEACMKRLGIPAQVFLDHQQRHAEMLSQSANLIRAAINGHGMVVRDVAAQIREWVIDHVIEYDFDLKKYLPASSLGKIIPD